MSNIYIVKIPICLISAKVSYTQYKRLFTNLICHKVLWSLLLIVFWISGSPVHAQIIISDPDALLDKPSLDSMYQQALIVAASKRKAQVDFQYCNILYNNNVWKLIPDGHFDMYEWQDGKWFNTYRKDDLGYNFFSTKFIHKDKIHSYGGYGFWKLNSDIISYNHVLREWIISKDYKEVPQGVCLPGHNKLVIVSGNKLSMLDLISAELDTCLLDVVAQFQLFRPTFTLVGKHYTVFLEEKLQLLIQKPENHLYTLKIGALNKVHLTRKEDCIHVKEDSLFIYAPDFNEKFRESLQANFDQYDAVECPKHKSPGTFWKSITLMIILLGAVLTVFLLKRNKSGKKTDQVYMQDEPDNSSIFDKIIKTAGSTLTQEKLDLIFDIPDDISPETKRFRRATLITEINNKSKLLLSKEIIIRIKDPMDKRKYLYYIEL
jgi:hypothetical protein